MGLKMPTFGVKGLLYENFCPSTLYTLDPVTQYLSPAILFPRHLCLNWEFPNTGSRGPGMGPEIHGGVGWVE